MATFNIIINGIYLKKSYQILDFIIFHFVFKGLYFLSSSKYQKAIFKLNPDLFFCGC